MSLAGEEDPIPANPEAASEPELPSTAHPVRAAALLLAVTAAVYAVTSYGGIRSPDSEIVFRVCESLALRGSFAVEEGLAYWPGFGLSPGTDGRQYAVFGPLQSILCVPLYALARLLGQPPFETPLSHFVDKGIIKYAEGIPTERPEVHAIRFYVSFLNSAIVALSVVLFFFILHRMTRRVSTSFIGALLLAFGSLMWPYAGTFFSEPLAIALSLLSFHLLLLADPSFGAPGHPRPGLLLGAGTALGLAATAHLTAVLFLPFFGLYACSLSCGGWRNRSWLRSALLFGLACAIPALLLGLYNQARFGSPLETGRSSIDPMVALRLGYGVWVAPWRNLVWLLVSPGKGLLLYSPLVIGGLLCWRSLHRRQPFLSWMLAGAILLRLVFIAARSDWHGGYSIGPRYLLMLSPFLLLPIPLWLEEGMAERGKRLVLITLAGTVAAVQQLQFCIGEIFSYYHMIRWAYLVRGVNIFVNDRVYLDWEYSPLPYLLEARRGAWLLLSIPLDSRALWNLLSLILALAAAVCIARILRLDPSPRADAEPS